MNVVTVLRTGGDFSFQDVELLTIHLKKNWNGNSDLNVYCIYNAIDKEYQLADATLIPCTNTEWPGWWSKMNLFSPDFEKLRPFLYLDLDTAIVGDITDFVYSAQEINKFIALSDFYNPTRLASGVMYIPNTKGTSKVNEIWNKWITNPTGFINQFRGDQDFLRLIGCDLYWQNITYSIYSFKPRDKHGKINWLTTLPKNASIVCFHGKPRIFEACSVNWVFSYIKKQNLYEE